MGNSEDQRGHRRRKRLGGIRCRFALLDRFAVLLAGLFLLNPLAWAGSQSPTYGFSQTPLTLGEALGQMSHLSSELDQAGAKLEETKERSKGLDEEILKLQQERDALAAEKEKALKELARGDYCSECKRPASQIEREEKESFGQHLTRVRGRALPASQQMIDDKEREYDDKIAKLGRDIDALVRRRAQLQLDAQVARQSAERALLQHRTAVAEAERMLQLQRADARALANREGAEIERLASAYETARLAYERARVAFESGISGVSNLGGLSEDEVESLSKQLSALSELRREADRAGDDLRSRRLEHENQRDQRLADLDARGAEIRDKQGEFEGRAARILERPLAANLPSTWPGSSAPFPASNPVDPLDDGDSWDRLFDGDQLAVSPSDLPDTPLLRSLMDAASRRLSDAIHSAGDSLRGLRDLLRPHVQDAVDDAIGGILDGAEPPGVLDYLEDKLKEYAGDSFAATLDDLWARARFGKSYDDLSDSDQVTLDADKLFYTAIQAPGSDGYFDWFDRAFSFFDKWIPRITGSEAEEPR